MAIKIRSGNQWVPVSGGGGEPIGTITVWSGASSNIPDGYRLCDGSLLSRDDFSALFAAIGTTHGAGDGSTTFKIPDLVDKFVVGASDSTGDTTYPGVSPGATGGQANAIVPNHTHPTSVTNSKVFPGAGGESISFGGAGSYPATTFTMSNPTNGEAVTNKNLPPYYALCYVIKVFNTKITITGSGGGVIVQDEGSALATTATTLNFVGDNVVASGTGATKTITISSSSGSNVTNSLNITGDEGSDATLNLIADQGDDNDDKWRIRSDATSNDLKFETYTSGSWSDGTPLRMQSNGNTYLTGQLIVDKVNINDNVVQLNSGTEDLKIRGNGTSGTYHLNLDDDVSITGNLKIGSGETVNIIRDEDDMSSNDADALATQQSIKAYVDNFGRIKQIREAASTGESGTGQSYTDKVTLTMTVENNSRVMIISSYELQSSTPFGSGNNTMAKTIKDGGSFVGEEVVNAHNGYYSYTGSKKYDIFYDTANGAGSRSYKIQWKRLNTGTGYIRNARLLGIELGIDP